MRHLLALCTLIFTLSSSVHANEPLPIEAYGQLPDVSNIQISTDGSYVSWVKNHNGVLVLTSFELATGKTRHISQADNIKASLNWYAWANDNTMLVSVRFPTSNGRVKYTATALMKINVAEDEGLSRVFKKRSRDHNPQFQDNVISMLPNEPDRIMLGVDFDLANHPSVYKFNLKTGAREKILRYKGNIIDWYADTNGTVRLGKGLDDTKVFYRLYDEHADEWRNIWEYEVLHAPSITVLGFDKDPNFVYIRALHEDNYAVFKVDLSSDSLNREVVFYQPGVDFDGSLIRSPQTQEVVGLSQSSAENTRIYWDKSYTNFQKALDNALPDSTNRILDTDKSMNRYILYSSSAKDPGSYFFGDRSVGELQFLGQRYPLINETNYAGKSSIEYQARDGLNINGYLTVPVDYKKGERRPAIVLPHGGPMARDYAGFDYWSELLANRGYVVLQPNFRGSTGYGFEFEKAGLANWGREMQDDLEDAAKWLVAQEIVDANNICIAGGSYGGYAALMAAVKQSQTFKCAASFAGVSDLEILLIRARNYTNSDVVKRQLGDDYSVLEDNSPVNLAEEIDIPILLIHGTADRVVDVDHSQDMADELEDEDKQVRYIELEDGDHHLSVQTHRMQTLTEMVNFFDKHLKQETEGD